MIEKLLLELGGSVTGAVFRLWLQNSEVARRASARTDGLIRRFVDDGREQRAMRRDFERAAEEIARRLEPFFDAEFGGVPENEKVAAGHAVSRTLDEAPISDALLFSADFDPQVLEAELRASVPDAAGEALLSEAGTAFYDQLLREVSNYVIEIRMRLPDFETEARRTLFRRETELKELVVEVLDRLPARGSAIEDGEVAAFEAQYRRDVARRLDQLELFGVTTTQARRPYPLTVAYLTLTASGRFDSLARDGVAPERLADEEEDRVSVPVDLALSRCGRVLIRGEAGSGKTTLLRWLAVNSARGRFADELAEWNDTVPFLLAMRRYVDSDLPAVDAFPAAVNQHAAPPDNWVRDRLRDGTALVLVDGIDELPDDRREAAREWLVDLVATYPAAKYVVTSRPPAVGEDWLAVEDFEPLTLEPMGLSAITAFIDHWHDAVATSEGEGGEEVGHELADLANDLTRRVHETRSIRSLASSPLLCAMLCALNRDRRAQIPSDRIELYRIALEMLLERRDAERRVTTGIAHLGLREKEILLRVFALWLLNNGKSEAAADDLVALVAERLPAMPRVDASPAAVVENLLLRSGLLRQPAEGRVDFIHRTFLEYLAAKEAVETRSVGMLLEHADQDHWQEVVVLAAGLANLAMREELIAGLIKRGNREPRSKHRLHLLAVECLETSAELSPALTEKLEALLERLIPPRSLTEAKAIASAGELATARLGREAKGAKAAEAAACVRALSLIGGESALAQLERFGPDPRVTVARELVRGWQEFPAEEYDYAGRVLRRSPLDYGRIEVLSPAELEAVGAMERARVLVVNGRGTRVPAVKWPWPSLAGHPTLAEVELTGLAELAALPPLGEIPALSVLRLAGPGPLERIGDGELPNVERLEVRNAPSLVDVGGIGSLERLRYLRMMSVERLASLPALPDSLERAFLTGVAIPDLASFAGCAALEVLKLRRCEELLDVGAVAVLPRLLALAVDGSEGVEDLVPIGSASQLDALALRRIGSDADASPLGRCTALTRLALEGSPSLEDVSWLEPLTRLEVLSLAGCPAIRGLDGVALPALERLFLTGCTGLSDLAWVGGMPGLGRLDLGGCERIADLGPLSGLRDLWRLDLVECSGIEDVSPLLGLPSLRWVDARGCSKALDPQLDALEERGVSVRTGSVMRGPRTAAAPRIASPGWHLVAHPTW